MKGLILLLLLTQSLAQAQCVPCQKPNPYLPYLPFYDWWPLPFLVPEPGPEPVELIKIEKEIYERNKKASFCKRPPEMVDTLVLHHSETSSTATAQYINELHLNRGTPSDPWYMIAYSYVINSPYAGGKIPAPKVTEGRPLDLVGAHAGSNVFVPMDEEQEKLFEEGKITCGKEGGEFKVDPSLIKNGKIKANVTTVGIVVNGSYTPFSSSNPRGTGRIPTSDTLDMIARLSCQLQKQYPRMKYMKVHRDYHSTTCPGTIQGKVSEIIKLAKGYGCDFN